MPNIKFFYTNLWDAETLEASTEATNYPAENTQQRWKRKTWNATGDTSEYIRTAGGTAIVVNAFFIFYHNVTAGGTVTVKGSNTNWATSVTIGTMTRTDDMFVLIPASTQTYDDFGFWVADASNPDTYVKLGRIWMGISWEPAYGYNPKVVEQSVDPSLVMTSTHGAKSTLEKTKFKSWQMAYDELERSEFDLFFSAVGTSKPFVILKKPVGYTGLDYPNPESNSFYVSATKIMPMAFAGVKIKSTMSLEEER